MKTRVKRRAGGLVYGRHRSSSVSIPAAFRTERRTRRGPALYNFLTSIEGQSLLPTRLPDSHSGVKPRFPKMNLDNIQTPRAARSKSQRAHSDLDFTEPSANFRIPVRGG